MTEQTGSPQREGSSVVVKVLYIEDNDDDDRDACEAAAGHFAIFTRIVTKPNSY
jgi:hypothetical protein